MTIRLAQCAIDDKLNIRSKADLHRTFHFISMALANRLRLGANPYSGFSVKVFVHCIHAGRETAGRDAARSANSRSRKRKRGASISVSKSPTTKKLLSAASPEIAKASPL